MKGRMEDTMEDTMEVTMEDTMNAVKKKSQVSQPRYSQLQTFTSIQQDKNITHLIQTAAIKQQTTPQRGPNDHQRRSIQLVQDLKNKPKRLKTSQYIRTTPLLSSHHNTYTIAIHVQIIG